MMGNSKYLDGLNANDYHNLTRKLWEIQGHKCFICEENIDLDIQSTNIDHIKPLANGGKDEPANFAVTHSSCNKSKQDADLEVARSLAKLSRIIKSAENAKETPSLRHVLIANGGSKYPFKTKVDEKKLIYSYESMGDCSIRESEIFTDSLSGEQSVFINLPIEYLFHDEDINPRGINSTINLLVKEFHKPNPQLHLCLARLDGEQVKIFDGQHKAVAQIMLGVRSITVRLFIHPDVDRLTETNLNAGSKLKQIAFDKAIVRQLHDTLYSERIKKYQEDHFLEPDDYSFSEQKLVNHFKGERGNVRLYIINSQKHGITRSPDNLLQSYINFEGRGNALPLSASTFDKTFLAAFINPKTILTSPINYRTDEGLNPRILERDQAIRLCNIIAEELLIGRYDTEIGTYRIENNIAAGKGDDIPDKHLIAYRMFKEEIMYNWVKYLLLLIKNHLAYSGQMYDDQNILQQQLPEPLWEHLRTFIINLRELPLWKDRSMASTIFGGKNNYDFWKCVFATGKTPDGTMVLTEPINVTTMISK